MKKILLIIGLVVLGLGLFVFGFYFQNIAQKFNKPKILVNVNGIDVLDTELKREMRFLQVSENSAISDITREDVLDRMINDILILAEAKRLQLSVSDPEIDVYVANVWKGYSGPELEKIQKQSGFKIIEWRELIRKRLLVERTIKKVIEDQVYVGDEELEENYWTNINQFYRQARVHARQIVVETKEQAETLKKRLAGGEKFENLAKQYSRGPEKDQGGDLGWVEKTDLPQAFSHTLFQLRPGEVSDLVPTQYGVHLFLVEGKEEGGKIPMEEAKKMIAEDLRVEKSNRAFQSWLENLRTQAKIEVRGRGVE